MFVGRDLCFPRGPSGLNATTWATSAKFPSVSVTGCSRRYRLHPSNSHLPPARTNSATRTIDGMRRVWTDRTGDPYCPPRRLRTFLVFWPIQSAHTGPYSVLQFTQQAQAQFPEPRIKHRRDTNYDAHETDQLFDVYFLSHVIHLPWFSQVQARSPSAAKFDTTVADALPRLCGSSTPYCNPGHRSSREAQPFPLFHGRRRTFLIGY